MRRMAASLAFAIGAVMNSFSSVNPRCCPVLELRQYTLKPGQRDALIDLFDREFVESQEAAGMTVVGQFRDRRDPDRFVWLRGFPGMESRRKSLEAFYDGPIWARYKTEANSTMLDSDNVLLLKPARPELGFAMTASTSASEPDRPATVLAGIYALSQPADSQLVSRFEQQVAPLLAHDGVGLRGVFVTESSPNTFRLPVREGEQVLVWFGTLDGQERSPAWLERLARIAGLDGRPVTLLELEPTSRSLLGHGRSARRATQHDFDFLSGSWTIHNRYLTDRLRHGTQWLEFEARSQVEPLLSGFGQLDRYSAVRDGQRFEAITLRLFDPATGEWSLHWADTARARTLLPPMVGRFAGEVGEFYGEETVEGRRVLCRFLWTRTGPGSPRWEQAFSDDGGKSWETNWIMTFTRQ